MCGENVPNTLSSPVETIYGYWIDLSYPQGVQCSSWVTQNGTALTPETQLSWSTPLSLLLEVW